jgi:hypothetical protein
MEELHYDVSYSLYFNKPTIGDPTLSNELNLPVPDIDRTKIKILGFIDKSTIKIEEKFQKLKANPKYQFKSQKLNWD